MQSMLPETGRVTYCAVEHIAEALDLYRSLSELSPSVRGTYMADQQQVVDVADALGDSQLFGALLEDELAALVRLGSLARYPAGQLIFARGDPGDSLMVVLEGRIRISSQGAD